MPPSFTDAASVCQVPRADPAQTLAKLRHDGWNALEAPLPEADRIALAIAAMARDIQTAERLNEKTRDPIWKEFWARAVKVADASVDAGDNENRMVALRHHALDSYMLFATAQIPNRTMVTCSFTIPGNSDKGKLLIRYMVGKVTPGGFTVVVKRESSLFSRARADEVYVLPDPKALAARLGVASNISMVFSTYLTFAERDLVP